MYIDADVTAYQIHHQNRIGMNLASALVKQPDNHRQLLVEAVLLLLTSLVLEAQQQTESQVAEQLTVESGLTIVTNTQYT